MKTKEEVIRQSKLTAINSIRNMHHSDYTWEYHSYSASVQDQRDEAVADVIFKLNQEITQIKRKYRED